MRAYLFLACGIMFLAASVLDVSAQQIEISSSPNPVGSGARAMGMGGAFIAVADDATAASWNPGGLIQLERPEISVVYSYYLRRESYTSQSHPETGGSNEMSSSNLNYLSAAYPFSILKRNMVLSVNYQHLYDFTKDIKLNYNWQLSSGTLRDRIDFKQEGGLWTLSPAFAIQVTPKFSFGMTFNVWENVFGDNGWTAKYDSAPSGTVNNIPVEMKIQSSDEFDFSGQNMHFGFLWNIGERLTLGGVYKMPFTADVKRGSSFYESQTFPAMPAFNSESRTDTAENLELDMPDSYGLGFAVRVSDNFTMDLDLYRTEWGRFTLRDSAGNETSPVTGKPKGDTDIKPTHQVRLGGEYLFIFPKTIIPLRAGIFYDPEPSEGNPEDYYGASIGSGFMWKKIVLDAAYQYRFGNDVEGDVIGVPNTSADVNQHLVLVSAIYHF